MVRSAPGGRRQVRHDQRGPVKPFFADPSKWVKKETKRRSPYQTPTPKKKKKRPSRWQKALHRIHRLAGPPSPEPYSPYRAGGYWSPQEPPSIPRGMGQGPRVGTVRPEPGPPAARRNLFPPRPQSQAIVPYTPRFPSAPENQALWQAILHQNFMQGLQQPTPWNEASQLAIRRQADICANPNNFGAGLAHPGASSAIVPGTAVTNTDNSLAGGKHGLRGPRGRNPTPRKYTKTDEQDE